MGELARRLPKAGDAEPARPCTGPMSRSHRGATGRGPEQEPDGAVPSSLRGQSGDQVQAQIVRFGGLAGGVGHTAPKGSLRAGDCDKPWKTRIARR